jgi:hypothetical protein
VGRPHLAEPGDSVYGIAAGLVEEDAAIGTSPRLVRDVADDILRRNLGREMSDGSRFREPSLIRIGWVLDVPVRTRASIDPRPAAVEVVRVADVVSDAEFASHEGVGGAIDVDTNDEVPVLGAVATSDTPPIANASSAPSLSPTTTNDTAAGAEPPDDRGTPLSRGLGGAVLLCAGALGLVESRRRHQLRRARIGAVAPATPPVAAAVERTMRRAGVAERAARLDLALRVVGHRLIDQRGAILGALTEPDGSVIVLVAGSNALLPIVEPFTSDDAHELGSSDLRGWRLPGDVPMERLAESARLAGQPCPALVHVGSKVGDPAAIDRVEVFVDVEAVGLLTVDGPVAETEAILGTMVASLVVGSLGDSVRLVAHGVDDAVIPECGTAERAESLDDALDRAATLLGALPGLLGDRRIVDLRVRGVGGERWEPVVVVHHDPSHTTPTEVLDDLVAMARGGGRALGVISSSPLSVDEASAGRTTRLRRSTAGWRLEPWGIGVTPVGVERHELLALVELLRSSDEPFPFDGSPDGRHADVTPVPSAVDELGERRHRMAAPVAWSLPEHHVVVRLFGVPRVTLADGTTVRFDRGRSVELLAWLATHRERPTRIAARTAMWDVDVRDATFANVVSDARRSLGRAAAVHDDRDWIERTLTDRLPLHPGVTTDADLIRAALHAARHRSAVDALAVLDQVMPLLAGAPFLGTDYLWPDPEGITSQLVLLAIELSATAARHHLELGDITGVFTATAAGLDVLPGHEELIALRMRAHAEQGDLAGVRSEWSCYERSLQADTFGDGEPAPKLVQLRRHLLAS